jgi:hypothetical protein
VHTNGVKGTKPTGDSPSVVFPWGGHVALKSGYGANDTWAFFDAGLAYGSSGHAHMSKLMLNVRAHKTMLLVDSGRFSYNGEGISVTLNREYERETHAHNTRELHFFLIWIYFCAFCCSSVFTCVFGARTRAVSVYVCVCVCVCVCARARVSVW